MKEDTSEAGRMHLSTDNDAPHSAPLTEIGGSSLEEPLREKAEHDDPIPTILPAAEKVLSTDNDVPHSTPLTEIGGSSLEEPLRDKPEHDDPITILPAAEKVQGEGGMEVSEAEADFQIQCDIPTCGSWYHSHELDPPLTSKAASQYKSWHCPNCVPYHGPSVQHARRSGLRKRKHIDFVKLNDPSSILENEGRVGAAESDVQDADFEGMLRSRQNKGMFTSGSDKRIGCLLQLTKDEDFNVDYVSSHGFDRPVLFKKTPDALGLKVPRSINGEAFSVSTVAKLVGPYRKVQVIDSATQLTTEYTMAEYADYLNTPS